LSSQISRVSVSDYGSSAMTPCAEASGESRSRVVKKGIPWVRSPPRYRVVLTVGLVRNLNKEIDQ
jgi:hypothetical protein